MNLHQHLEFYENARGYIDSDPQLREIRKIFGKIAFRRSSILDGMGKFIAKANPSGKRCVEIGTYNGITAVVLARYFDEVVSIDVLPREMKHQIIECLEIKNIRFIDVKNNEEKKAAIKRLDFDFAYIDGNHMHETDVDFELVKRAGRVMFHDVKPGNKPVYALVNSLKQIERDGMFAICSV